MTPSRGNLFYPHLIERKIIRGRGTDPLQRLKGEKRSGVKGSSGEEAFAHRGGLWKGDLYMRREEGGEFGEKELSFPERGPSSIAC